MATLKSNIPRIVSGMRARAQGRRSRTAAEIAADAKDAMGGPKSGRAYKRRGQVHVASAPGEAPANYSGDYADSIVVVQVDDSTSAVGSTDARGPALELGGGRVAARPHLGPAFERAAEDFRESLGRIFEG